MLYREPADSQLGPSLVTVADAAKILNRLPIEVDQFIAAGEIASEVGLDGRRRVDLASLQAFREERA